MILVPPNYLQNSYSTYGVNPYINSMYPQTGVGLSGVEPLNEMQFYQIQPGLHESNIIYNSQVPTTTCIYI